MRPVTGPPVSVLIPTFNQIAFVDEAIESAVTQDYEPLQVVIVDDGSTDGTAEAIRRWAARYPARVLAMTGLPHVGMAANWNRGLHACSGTYVAFSAGDDVYLPGKIAAQVGWLEADERRVACGHDCDVFDATGRTLHRASERRRLRSGCGACGVVHAMPFPPLSMMLRRRAIPPYGYDERARSSADAKLLLDTLGRNGAYGVVPGVLARYRRHAGSVSSPANAAAFRAHYLDNLAYYRLVAAQYPELAERAERLRRRLLWSIAAYHLRRGEREEALPFLSDALSRRCGDDTALADRLASLLPASLILGPLWVARALKTAVTRARAMPRTTRTLLRRSGSL